MTISACQLVVKNALTGLSSPGYQTTEGFIAPMVPGNVAEDVPQCYVWGGRGTQKRRSGGRASNPISAPSTGFVRVDHTISVWIIAIGPNDEPPTRLSRKRVVTQTTKFPALIEAARQALLNVQMPQVLIDPTTGAESQLWSIGEDISWQYDVDRTLSDQRYVRHLCLLDCSVSEDINA